MLFPNYFALAVSKLPTAIFRSIYIQTPEKFAPTTNQNKKFPFPREIGVMVGVGGTGKKKIEIKKKEKASQLQVTFSKRRKGLVKKINDLHSKTAAKAALALFTPSGRPFTSGEPDFDSVVDQFFKSVGRSDGESSNSGSTSSNSNVADDNGEEFDGSETVAFGMMKNWLEGVKVEEYDNLEELQCLINKLEGVQTKFDDLQFLHSLLIFD